PRFAWAQDPNKLWRQAAQAEHDLNAEVARETRFSLNPNLPIEAGGRILEKVMQEYVDENGSAVDIIIYSKPVVDSGIDSPQYQAVVFETTRQITPEGFGDRTPPEEE